MLAIETIEFKLKSLSDLKQSADSTSLSGRSLGLATAFPQSQKTLAAFLSGDRCLGHPKVKWFALERSPNVSHLTTIAQLTRIPARYPATGFKGPSRRSARQVLKFLTEDD
jgi:hypothetical protein